MDFYIKYNKVERTEARNEENNKTMELLNRESEGRRDEIKALSTQLQRLRIAS
jgi:hypothetical protein